MVLDETVLESHTILLFGGSRFKNCQLLVKAVYRCTFIDRSWAGCSHSEHSFHVLAVVQQKLRKYCEWRFLLLPEEEIYNSFSWGRIK